MVELTFTTNAGLEALALEELRARLAERSVDPEAAARAPGDPPGRLTVRVDAGRDAVMGAAMAMRTVHHVLRPVGGGALADGEGLARISALVSECAIPELAEARTFCVRSVRSGRHDFSSLDVQRRAGAVLVARSGLKVDLERPERVVRVDVLDREVRVGVQLTGEALSRRQVRVYHQRVALRPNVAYAAVRAVGLTAPARIADPFCGTGTILLEAGHAFSSAELWGSDWKDFVADGARANLDAAGLAARAHIVCADARAIADVYPEAGIDAVITNPPYGSRLGQGINWDRFYPAFLDAVARVLKPGGRLALFTIRPRALARAARAAGFAQVSHRTVAIGPMHPRLVVLNRARPEAADGARR